MTNDLQTRLAAVARTVEREGLVALAVASGVPYSTVRSFDLRGWRHSSLPIIAALCDAAERMDAKASNAPTTMENCDAQP
jgi:hypothetical protein